jgi:hypothetical protein
MMALGICVTCWWVVAAQPRPTPAMGPGEVVRTVVTALHNNNSPIPNAGIFTAYQFASARNRAVTRPYGYFLAIAKSDSFAALLHNDSFDTDAVVITGGSAQEMVTLHRKGRPDVRFRFNLSLQQGCWMVDGVSR